MLRKNLKIPDDNVAATCSKYGRECSALDMSFIASIVLFLDNLTTVAWLAFHVMGNGYSIMGSNCTKNVLASLVNRVLL